MRYFHGKLGMLWVSCAITSLTYAHTVAVSPIQEKKEEKQFIQLLVTKDHFNRYKLEQLFKTLHENPKIIQSMTSPFEKKPWSFYRDYFVTPERVTLGAKYLKDHHNVLQAMSKKYGIPASIIVAIIGVETEYGTHLGKYPALSTLYTLGFYYPPREKFFRKELEQYLILTRDNKLPVSTLKGSYAGALGIPQFMPSSYRYYGIAFQKNSPVNLFNNNDAIASVANYFHKMGWASHQPITYRLNANGKSLHDKTLNLITLPLNKGAEYWVTYKNFKVIMSYNHNIVYAMAVYQLSKKIEQQYAKNNGKVKSRTISS